MDRYDFEAWCGGNMSVVEDRAQLGSLQPSPNAGSCRCRLGERHFVDAQCVAHLATPNQPGLFGLAEDVLYLIHRCEAKRLDCRRPLFVI